MYIFLQVESWKMLQAKVILQNLLGGLARRSIYCQAPVHVKFHVNISQAPPVPGPEGDCGLDTRGPSTEAVLTPHSYPHSQTVRLGVVTLHDTRSHPREARLLPRLPRVNYVPTVIPNIQITWIKCTLTKYYSISKYK